jgi:mannan endo-1,4-beta-mannosidase
MPRLRNVVIAIASLLLAACAGKGELLPTEPEDAPQDLPAQDLLPPNGVPLTQPANARASADAIRLYSWLRALPGRPARRMLSGQSFGLADAVSRQYEPMFQAIERSTGHSVAIAAGDYGVVSPARGTSVDLGVMNQALVSHWNRGGLVTLSWRAPNPWTDGDATDRSIVGPFSKLTETGKPLNVKWMRELSRVADGLEALQRAGVVVLWRPFNEVNGTQYWWSSRGVKPTPGEFAALWKHMFDYFTNVRHLNNVLWVYSVTPRSGDSMRPETYFWPGQTRVDVVSIELSHPGQGIAAWSQLKALAKPLALGDYRPTVAANVCDYGELLDLVRSRFPEIVYFVAPDGTSAMNAQPSASALLWDGWVANLADVDWRK